MIRAFGVLSAVLAMCPFGVWHAGPSAASPAGGAEQCSFVLTPPKVVSVSGVDYVTATVHTGTCPLNAHSESTVCLSVEGDESAGKCAWAFEPNSSEVYYPYRRGATYVVKGQGCVDLLEGSTSPASPSASCYDIPASRVTL